MGWRVDNFEGEMVDVQDLETNKLQEIRRRLLEVIEFGITTALELRRDEDDLDVVEEELLARGIT